GRSVVRACRSVDAFFGRSVRRAGRFILRLRSTLVARSSRADSPAPGTAPALRRKPGSEPRHGGSNQVRRRGGASAPLDRGRSPLGGLFVPTPPQATGSNPPATGSNPPAT